MRKNVYILILLLVFCSVSEAVPTDLVQQEEEGLETRTLTIATSQVRITRDIPEGGLLLIPDSQNDRVMAFDPLTGDIYDENFIPSDPTNLSTPIQAALHPDGNSILVSDQLNDGLLEYDLDGNFVGWFAPAGGVNNAILDNVRGWGLKADGNILVTTAGGSNSDAIVEFDTSGNNIGNFIANGAGGLDGPWEIIYRLDHSDYLVTASTSGGIHRYDMNGAYLGDFATGFSFTEQITETESGNILVASFSAPSGVHEFASDGTFIGYYDVVGSLRGVYELPNGNILVTNSGGVYEINRNNTIVSTKISGVNARSIDFVEPVSPFPPPTNVSVSPETGLITWDPPVTNMTRDLIGYNIYLDDMTTPIASVGPDVYEYQYTDLTLGQEYIAGVSAVYDEGESVIVEVPPFTYEPVLNPPQNIEYQIIEDHVLLTWDEPQPGSTSPFLHYNIYVNGNQYQTEETTYEIYGLINGQTYLISITAEYEAGESEYIEVEFVYTGTLAGDEVQSITKLCGNHPNPFNPETKIKFALKEDSDVSIKIYNIKGAVVRTLVDGEMKAAYHKIIWDSKDNTGKQVGSGLYFYKMISEGNSGDYTSTKKMILLK